MFLGGQICQAIFNSMLFFSFEIKNKTIHNVTNFIGNILADILFTNIT